MNKFLSAKRAYKETIKNQKRIIKDKENQIITNIQMDIKHAIREGKDKITYTNKVLSEHYTKEELKLIYTNILSQFKKIGYNCQELNICYFEQRYGPNFYEIRVDISWENRKKVK